MSNALPAGFEDLRPFVDAGWSLATEYERMRKRRGSTRAEIKAFYDALMPRAEAIVTHMDRYPYPNAPEDAQRLFYLVLSLCEVAPHVELFRGNPAVPYSFEERRLTIPDGATPGVWGAVAETVETRQARETLVDYL